MKKILQLAFAILLAKSTLILGQEVTKINGPLEVRGNSGTPATSGTNQNRIASFSSNDTYGTLYLGNNLATPFGLWLQSSGRNDLSVNYPLLLNPNGGNVGIGTSAPQAKLHVAYNSAGYSSILSESSETAFTLYTKTISREINAETFRLGLKYNENENNGFISFFRGGDSGGGSLGFSSSGIERIRVASNGNVGIGTTTPISLLQTNGNLTVGFGNTPSIVGIMQLRSDGTTPIANKITYGTDGTGWGFAISKNQGGVVTDQFFVKDNGNVGIGTNLPTAKLDVNGTANFTNSILLSGGSGSNANKIGFNADANNYYIQGISNGMQYSPYSVGNFSFSSGNGNWNFANGTVGIGITTMPINYKLAVGGDIIAERVVVKLQTNWPDYVFNPCHKRATLPEVEKYINQNHHLPNIPSAKEVAERGIDVGSMNTKFMEKIEELTLYLIEQNKKLETLEKKNAELENAIKNIKK